jgi:hypothetical protein
MPRRLLPTLDRPLSGALDELARLALVRKTDRSCGTCDACCVTHGVEELDKPAMVTCKHLRDAGSEQSPTEVGQELGRCSVYAERPKSCREWSCLWRFGMFEDDARPDKLGVVLDLTGRVPDLWPGPTHQAIIARGSYPGALDTPHARAWLTKLAEKTLVILLIDVPGSAPLVGGAAKHRKILGPPELLEYVQTRMRQKGLS